LEYSVDNYLDSEEFDWKVTDRELDLKEKQRKQQLRATALAKLTKEEREVLGI
jgi:hypothetical protein